MNSDHQTLDLTGAFFVILTKISIMKKSRQIIRVLLAGFLIISPFCLKAQYTKLMDFDPTSGRNPYGSLILDETTQMLYGMAYNGGDNDLGTIFKYDLNGGGYTKLMDLSASTGTDPHGSLLKVGSTLFGMTSAGGANGYGTIFKIGTNGSNFSVIFDFDLATTGGTPYGSLIISGNTLYGMTSGGGANSKGVVFSVDTTGNNYTKIHEFAGTDGEGPYGDVVLTGNYLFGMTKYGGSTGVGVIFKVQTDGSGFLKMFNFDWVNSGGYPNGSLTLNGTDLFGMTSQGGDNGVGVVFKTSTSGLGFNKLFNFETSTSGRNPLGNLVYLDGDLYGMIDGSGQGDYGSIFKLAGDGSSFTRVLIFTDPIWGSQPKGTPVLVSETVGITYYGMMWTGGVNNYGVIFKNYDLGTGIASVKNEQDIRIFPVPAQDFIQIQSGRIIRSVGIYDLLGRSVFSGQFDTKEIRLPLGDFEKGVYLLRMECDGLTVARKFLKE
jgi:uncharacterized repeat protein (TIGR03803 family)